MELSVLKTDGSLCLLIPKIIVNELGWSVGDLLEFVPHGSVVELRNLGGSGLVRMPFRRGLRRFGGSYAVTIPLEVRGHFAGANSVP